MHSNVDQTIFSFRPIEKNINLKKSAQSIDYIVYQMQNDKFLIDRIKWKRNEDKQNNKQDKITCFGSVCADSTRHKTKVNKWH